MFKCPKCGSNRINGPYYRPSYLPSGDRLEYICAQCGYKERKPCLDDRDKERRDD